MLHTFHPCCIRSIRVAYVPSVLHTYIRVASVPLAQMRIRYTCARAAYTSVPLLRTRECSCLNPEQAGEDMRKVGEIFESDWLSIWGLNVHLDTFDPAPGTEVLIGRLYVVQTGDTLQTIAKEFGAVATSPP